MEGIKDPRNIFTDVIEPAKDYQVQNAVGPDLYLQEAKGSSQLILARNSVTVRNNPLLGELGLFDTVTIEHRVPGSIKAPGEKPLSIELSRSLPLIISVNKATREEIIRHMPIAILAGADHGKKTTLDDYLAESNYVPSVLQQRERPFQPTQIEEQED